MHPILFRIPLLKTPLKLWWAIVAVAVLLAIFGVTNLKKERNIALGTVAAALVLGPVAWKFRAVAYAASSLPIYSYGVMLGLSLVLGWYVTLTIADKEGLPRDPMATCYVVAAIGGMVGARLAYVVMNLDDFKTLADVVDMRKGGLLVYGAIAGGFFGSWAYLRPQGIRVLPWADAAAPSLGIGIITAPIGAYLQGSDFGKQLGDWAPAWLRKLGEFPHWPNGTIPNGDGSPPFVRHLALYRGSPLAAKLTALNHSFAVHPVQLYEALCGLALVLLFFALRKRAVFRGQMFIVVLFAYGVFRFATDFLRDDIERDLWGPAYARHLSIPLMLFLMSVGFIFGLSRIVPKEQIRNLFRIISLVPSIAAFFLLKPASFSTPVGVRLTLSQWIAFASTLSLSFLFAHLWQEARRQPKLAMSLGDGAILIPAPPEPAKEPEEPAESAGGDDAPSKDDEPPKQV